MISSLIEKLEKVKDFRQNRGKRHSLWKILLIIILGLMTGYLGYRGLESFIQTYRQELLNILKPKAEKLPSYSTLRRVIMGVDYQELVAIFNEWAYLNYSKKDELDWLALDGKSIRSTVVNCQNSQQNFIMVVSMFSQTTSEVVRLGVFESKEGSEVHQVQEMVRDCALKGKVFTGDSLHCNLTLATTILETNNHYLLAIKKNQIKLYERVKKLAESEKSDHVCVSTDRSHGREINRQTQVFNNLQNPMKKWQHLQNFIQVKRSGYRGSKTYEEIAYYGSSLCQKAEVFASAIQGHWGIENKLHWVKDVIFKEDSSPITHFQAATNFSTLKTIGMNFFKKLGFDSMTAGTRWLANPKNYIFLLSSEFG